MNVRRSCCKCRTIKPSATLALVREIQTLDASLMSDADDARMSLGNNYREAMARTTAANRYQQASRF